LLSNSWTVRCPPAFASTRWSGSHKTATDTGVSSGTAGWPSCADRSLHWDARVGSWFESAAVAADAVLLVKGTGGNFRAVAVPTVASR